MSFIDHATVLVAAGKGGDGALSFRHEKYVDKGGPDGGDGGRGGDVIFVADRNLNTLSHFRYKQELKAENGQAGSKRRRHGKDGVSLRVTVPVGTVIYDEENGSQLADLDKDGATVVVASGGKGGFGNAHFVSSTRQAPRIAELGEHGAEVTARLELKLLADIGLVGLPNAGKSTFLSSVSHARPEVADYAFTTLVPHLGVAEIDDRQVLIADIPGLIEGASEGKGLGDAFLRHIERTAILLHLIDAYHNDVAAAYQTIMRELEAYSADVATRPQVIALTKIEGLDEDIVAMQMEALRAVVPKQTDMLAISAQTGTGLKPLLRKLADHVAEHRAKERAAAEAALAEIKERGDVVIELPQQKSDEAWAVKKVEGRFIITGQKIERFAARTDFKNVHAANRLRDIMRKNGILHELARAGAEPSDIVQIGEQGKYQLTLGVQ